MTWYFASLKLLVYAFLMDDEYGCPSTFLEDQIYIIASSGFDLQEIDVIHILKHVALSIRDN